MTALEDALAALDDAQPQLPDHLASPTSEAARALLEEILSMPTATHEPEVLEPDEAPRRSRRRLVLVAAASVVALAAAAFAAVQLGGDEDDTVLILPAETPDRSGRLEVTRDLDWELVDSPMRLLWATEWSGDDVRSREGDVEFRRVDGQAWSHDLTLTQDADGGRILDGSAWSSSATLGPDTSHYEPPALDALGGAAAFTPVGDEEIAGVPTQRHRAVDPASVPVDVIDAEPWFDEGVVASVEAWVDGDGIVRRVDVMWTGSSQGEAFTDRQSFVWSDLGEPITIERPPVG